MAHTNVKRATRNVPARVGMVTISNINIKPDVLSTTESQRQMCVLGSWVRGYPLASPLISHFLTHAIAGVYVHSAPKSICIVNSSKLASRAGR